MIDGMGDVGPVDVFYNLSKLDLSRLLDDPDRFARNLNAWVNGFFPNVREIMERFERILFRWRPVTTAKSSRPGAYKALNV